MANISQYTIAKHYHHIQGNSVYTLSNSISGPNIQGFSNGDDERKLKALSVLQTSIFDDPISVWRLDPAQSIEGSIATLATAQSSSVVREKQQQFPDPKVDMQDVYQFMDYVDHSYSDTSVNKFVDELCATKGEYYVLNVVDEIYTRYPGNELLLCAVIDALSHIEYERWGRRVITLCMGLILVGTPLVWEHVANACSQWRNKDFIPCLQHINTESFLLKRLINKTIRRINGSEGA